jgi:hypothetical protein
VNLTTAQLETGALSVPCPEHKAGEGTECPHQDGSGEERESTVCLTRRSLAEARRLVAEFPASDDLDVMNWRQLRQLAEQMRDAAQDASSCVDTALAPFGIA